MKFNEYIQYDGIGLANLVKNKEIQSHELLEVAIGRAEQVNPKINAIVIPIYEHALNKVKNNQNASSNTFSGVPFLLKDLHQEYAGVPISSEQKMLKSSIVGKMLVLSLLGLLIHLSLGSKESLNLKHGEVVKIRGI